MGVEFTENLRPGRFATHKSMAAAFVALTVDVADGDALAEGDQQDDATARVVVEQLKHVHAALQEEKNTRSRDRTAMATR